MPACASDLALMRYLRGRWQSADAAERAGFEQLLDLPDPLLAAYLMGREHAPDPHLQRLVEQLRAQDAGALARSAGAGAPGIP